MAGTSGATGPADLMTKLRQRAIAEKDKQSASKGIKLLRQLLRDPNSSKRNDLLSHASTPKDVLIISIDSV